MGYNADASIEPVHFFRLPERPRPPERVPPSMLRLHPLWRSTILWKEAHPPTPEQIREAFGINLGELRPHNSGFEGDGFTDGRWFVKLWCQEPDSDSSLALTAQLAARGIPVPAARQTLYGTFTAEQRGRRYALFPFVEGRPATRNHSEAIARAMRNLHEITDLDLPRTEINEWRINVLRDQQDHPWIGDRREEILAAVDRLDVACPGSRDCTGSATSRCRRDRAVPA